MLRGGGALTVAEAAERRELGTVLTQFEHGAADTVTLAGGRVVKLIGDEVLYTTGDEASACTIALSLAATFAEHAVVPPVRAGLASGDVLLRDRDVFGPVVNLAARVVKIAAAGAVVAPMALAAGAGIRGQALGQRELKGFGDNVELCRLLGPDLRAAQPS